MAFGEAYRQQVVLLLRVLPSIAEEKSFALKGGTGINLFVRNMPRLSVDIDLTYLPVEPRPESLANIDAAMTRIKDRITKTVKGCQVTEARHDGAINKLFVRLGNSQIKIEVTPVIRGCVYEPETKSVSPAVEEFGTAEIQVVSFADLYAGKIVAALDRQHPRDLFDVRDLLANEGITDELRNAFLIYLISHDRPMHEVLGSKQKDISAEYGRGFQGMTAEDVPLEELYEARKALVAEIVAKMPKAHRDFLIGFERGEPDWKLIGLPGAAELPAVRWRQQNLDKLTAEKRAALVSALEKVLT
jgi:predicted nucleotidyltransferase component of viral defense system